MEEMYKVNFDFELLSYIYYCDNSKAKSLLSKNLVKSYDDFGTLLHYAAENGNATMARHLIEKGSDVDRLGRDGKTPLMLAVENVRPATIQVLLEADANVDVVDADGNSALQMILGDKYVATDILRLILKKVKNEDITIEDLVVKLTTAGCTLYRAAHFNDLAVMESMLENGVDVNSEGQWRRTALHAAAELDDLILARWLIDNGADVDAIDAHGKTALFVAACHGNKAMLKILLEQGANPNVKTFRTEQTALFEVVAYAVDTADRNECMQLLLQHGAVPHNRADYHCTIFDCAFLNGSPNRAECLIAQLALLERMGTSIDKSVMHCNVSRFQPELARLAGDYELCERVLGTVMFQKLTLFDLLTVGELTMMKYARNETFVSKITEICCEKELGKLNPYYYNTLMKRINEAVDAVKLESTVIPVICGFLGGNENEYYIAARVVISYLSKRDLEQLARA